MHVRITVGPTLPEGKGGGFFDDVPSYGRGSTTGLLVSPAFPFFLMTPAGPALHLARRSLLTSYREESAGRIGIGRSALVFVSITGQNVLR
jgi:hypothetical protein